MASKSTLCPNIRSLEWKMLVDENNGDHNAAMKAWENNNFDFPQHILDRVGGFATLENNDEEYSSDPYLYQKNQILEKSKGVLKQKLHKLANLVKKNPTLEEGKRELEQLLRDMERLEAEFGLHRFILAADRMSNTALKWMEQIKNGEKEATMENLKRMQEYVDSFSVLNDLREEFFNDPEHKKDFSIISDIVAKQNKIRNDYLAIARQKIADQFAPYFGKVEAEYRRKAEVEFNSNQKRELIRKGKKGAELEKAKHDFIENYMMAHALNIKLETEQYVHNMLIQVVDLGFVTNLLINPKDMNHDLMSMAVETLDRADYDITQKTIMKTREANRLYQNFVKQVGKHADPRKQYESILIFPDQDTDEDPRPVLMNSDYYGFEEFKKKYEGTAVWELQQFLEGLAKEKDMLVPQGSRLGNRLPHINKQSFERLANNGVLHTMKEGIIDQFKLRSEDTEFGDISGRLNQTETSNTVEVLTNESGKERAYVPLFYRAHVPLEELSFDVISSMLLDYNNSLNYKAKTETGIFLEVLKEVVSEAEINTRTDFKKLLKINKITGQAANTSEGQASNLNSALESLIRHRVYGIQTEGDPRVIKMIQTISSYTSIVSLAANHLSGSANLLHGQTVSWIEGFGNKNGAFSQKDRAKATAKYDKDLANIIADVGQRVPKSKTNLLIEQFNAFSDFHAVDKKFVENSRAKRLFNTGALLAFNNIGEHVIQSTVMYSILNNIKVQDAAGNYLNKNFEIVKDRSEAMSIDEAMFVNEKGNLEVDSRITKTEITDGVTQEDMFKISRKIRRTNRDLYGNYDQHNKSKLKRHAIGALTLQMRGWLLPGIQKRWRGIGTFRTANEKLDLDQRSYNQETRQFEEGTYTTALRFLWNLRGDVRALKMAAVPENWHNLTDAEKSNIKKAAIELGLAVILLGVATALRDGDEPEQIYAAYMTRRLYSELTTFIHPKEAVRTFRSPMIVISTAEAAIEFIAQLSDPFEVYETGKRRGEYKLNRKFTKLIPIWKQLDRGIEEALIFLER